MVSHLSVFLYGLAGLVLAGMALLVTLQEMFVYVPVVPGLTNSFPITPARLRLNYEDVWLRYSDGIRLHAWFFPDFRGPTILFFQENAGNIAHRLEMAALDHLSQKTDIDTSRIVVFGRPLGGAVGTVVTKKNPDKVAALIVENTFKSILDMAGILLPFRKRFIGGSVSKGVKNFYFVVSMQWNTVDIIGSTAMLNFTRTHPAATRNNRCVFMEFPSGMHMDTWLAGGGHYWQTIQQFLQENVSEKRNQVLDEREYDLSFDDHGNILINNIR